MTGCGRRPAVGGRAGRAKRRGAGPREQRALDVGAWRRLTCTVGGLDPTRDEPTADSSKSISHSSSRNRSSADVATCKVSCARRAAGRALQFWSVSRSMLPDDGLPADEVAPAMAKVPVEPLASADTLAGRSGRLPSGLEAPAARSEPIGRAASARTAKKSRLAMTSRVGTGRPRRDEQRPATRS